MALIFRKSGAVLNIAVFVVIVQEMGIRLQLIKQKRLTIEDLLKFG